MHKELIARVERLQIPYEEQAFVTSTLLLSLYELVIEPQSIQQVATLLPLLHELGTTYHVHGGGSDTLLLGTAQKPGETVIINTSKLKRVKIDERTGQVLVGGGKNICGISRKTAQLGLSGLEFAADIPGTVAGSIVTDAWHPIHSYADLFENDGLTFSHLPKHISEVLQRVTVMNPDGSIATLEVEALEMKNRSSIFSLDDSELLLLEAEFQLAHDDPQEIAQRRKVINLGRKRMRAKNKESNSYSVGKTLGYTFVLNHPAYDGKTAVEIIRNTQSLPKEILIDGMYHSQSTPNIICNTGDGHPIAYLEIIDFIREAVLEEHNIELPVEVNVVA